MIYSAKVISYDDEGELITLDIDGIGEVTLPSFVDILDECDDEDGYPIGSTVSVDLDPAKLREVIEDKES